eukprot:snap_masked-scaffold_9-processed-gene-10.19-mRNA-1 protein AED:1.00 eAED:1.00 QI:0/0/0/0/1/1/4/0/119
MKKTLQRLLITLILAIISSINKSCVFELIRVTTGNRRGAGTTAQVFIKLFGSKTSTDLINLTGDFDRASLVENDVYLDQTLGKLNKILIGHDNMGDQGVSWYLKQVEVISPFNSDALLF